MPSIAATICRLQSMQGAALAGLPSAMETPLRPLTDFGSNPGALRGWCYTPDDLRDVALVVVLHGCTQTAAGYDRGAGWSQLAQRYGFALLFPEQQRANNPNLCFNWFLKEDASRGRGEAESIREMIEAVVRRHAIDPRRVYVTGLSAGGAMANVMLATYPELFAGGSIIAGLPYGTAASVPEALERMRGAGHAGDTVTAALIERASSHRGKWPPVSVWHGDADRTVHVSNADAIVGQWRTLHGAEPMPARVDTVDGQQHRVWLGHDGQPAVEDYRIAGLGHGTPLRTAGPDGCGVAGPFMLEAGISSTWRQAERWGLLGSPRARPTHSPDAGPASPPVASGIAETIERALRSAGLMQ